MGGAGWGQKTSVLTWRPGSPTLVAHCERRRVDGLGPLRTSHPECNDCIMQHLALALDSLLPICYIFVFHRGTAALGDVTHRMVRMSIIALSHTEAWRGAADSWALSRPNRSRRVAIAPPPSRLTRP